MGLKPNIIGKTPCSAVRRLRKRPLSSSKAEDCTDKLEALKSLLPSSSISDNAETKPEQLFKETADYIVLLKTQVFVLQKLVEFYGSSQQSKEKPNSV